MAWWELKALLLVLLRWAEGTVGWTREQEEVAVADKGGLRLWMSFNVYVKDFEL